MAFAIVLSGLFAQLLLIAPTTFMRMADPQSDCIRFGAGVSRVLVVDLAGA